MRYLLASFLIIALIMGSIYAILAGLFLLVGFLTRE